VTRVCGAVVNVELVSIASLNCELLA